MKEKISYKELEDIIEDLLAECKNETIESENITELCDKELALIYSNVKLFTLKLKDKLEDKAGAKIWLK